MDSRHSPLAEPVLGLAKGKTRGLAHEAGNDVGDLAIRKIAESEVGDGIYEAVIPGLVSD
jgi:hypothetical protein